MNGIWIASCVTTGMICGGGFALATVPQAAFRWVAVLYFASLVALVARPGCLYVAACIPADELHSLRRIGSTTRRQDGCLPPIFWPKRNLNSVAS